MSGQSKFYVDRDYQESDLSGNMSTQKKLVHVQEMLEISKIEMADHVRKRLSDETDLKAYNKDCNNRTRHLVKDVWNAEGQSYALKDSSSETKEIERLDHINFELCIVRTYLHREFKRQNTEQESDIFKSQPHLTERECELTRNKKETNEKADHYHESIMTVQNEIEQLLENIKIDLDKCHKVNKEWKQLIEETASFLQENESPDKSCRVISSGNLKEETNQLRSGQESLIKQSEELEEQVKFVPQGNAQMPNPESIESDQNLISDSQSEMWELDHGEGSQKEPSSYPKPSIEQKGVKIELTHESGSNQFSLGSEEKTGTPKQDASEIIKILNDAFPVFEEEGAMCVIDHIEAYENTLSALGLDDDQSRINFLPWVFETKHRRFCESLKGLSGTSWQEIKHRCLLEFGQHKNVTVASVAIQNLRCASNQSPTEFLAVLKMLTT